MWKGVFVEKKRILINKLIHNIYIQSIVMTVAINWTLGLRTSNPFSVFLLIILSAFQKNETVNQMERKREKREIIVVNIISVLLALFWVLGNYETYENAGFLTLIEMIVSIIGIYLFVKKCLAIVVYKLARVNICSNVSGERKPVRFGICFFAICILCWLPYLLAYYPGIITDDAEWQLAQALGLRPFSNHQPWIHTMFHRFFYKIGYGIFHTANAGVAMCVVAQMCVMAAAFSYLCTIFYKKGVKKTCLLVCLIYFAIVPFNALYSVTLWKDVAMGAVVLLFSIVVWKITQREKIGGKNAILFLIMGLLLCILRSNGLYAYLLCFPFFVIFMKGKRKKIFILGMGTILLALVYKGPVLNYFNVTPPDTIESLSIPAQHIARVIVDGGTLTEEQEKLLSKAVDISKIKDTYDPALSDPIKVLVRQTGNQEYIATHKAEYLKLWIELGIKYPVSYLKAQIDQTKGYWYPDIQYWVTTTMIKENTWGMYRSPKMPTFVVDVMQYFETLYKQIPLLGILWSIGCYTWTMIVLGGVTICRKKSILPFFPVAAIIISLFIATPVQAEFRYSYSMMATIPLFFMIACSEEKNEKNSSFNSML